MEGTDFARIGITLAVCVLLLVGGAVQGKTWSKLVAPPIMEDAIDEVSYPFRGIIRTHRVTSIPRPLNINILEVALTDPGISLFVTPGNPDPERAPCGEVIARKTTTFVAEFGMQVGINGDFSDPDCSFSGDEGEPTGVYGLGVSYRKKMPDLMLSEIPRDQYSSHNNRPTLAFTQTNEAYIGCYEEDKPFPPEVYNAVGGNKILVENGRPVDPTTWNSIGGALELHPRTSVGLSSDGSRLIIIVVDGRQERFSEGVTLPEMAEYLIEFGAYTGLNLDGGGSSTLVFSTFSGPEIINRPPDGKERVRANHLGIYAVPSNFVYPDGYTLVSTLWQNYPNPCNPETWIPFALSRDVHVAIRIYDLSGGLVRTLDLGHKSAGMYVPRGKAGYWNGRNEAGETVASGIYFYNIQAGDFAATKKMLVRVK